MSLQRVPRGKRIAVVLTVIIFSGCWYWLSQSLTAWSDEVTHLSVAKAIARTGQPLTVALDRCDLVLEGPYTRNVELSWSVAKVFRFFGETLRVARSIPFLFTIAAWLVYAVYVRRRLQASPRQLLIVSLFFFGQSMVLEQALNVRMYAQMLFLTLLGLIAVWEARTSFNEHRSGRAIAWSVAAFLFIGLQSPRLHLLPLAIVLLALIVFWVVRQRAVVDAFLLVYRQMSNLSLPWKIMFVALIAYAIVSIGALTPWLIGGVSAKIGSVPTYATPWDNLMGILRFCLVTNVVLVAGVLSIRRLIIHSEEMDFHSWLLVSGVVSGLLLGYIMPNNFIFYSRYLYLSVALAVLGSLSEIDARLGKRPLRLALVAIVYLSFNCFVSYVTLGLDRNNVKEAIAWLKNNSGDQDLIVTYNANLSLHGGGELCQRSFPILRTQYQLLDVQHPSSQGAARPFNYLFKTKKEMEQRYLTAEDLRKLLSNFPEGNAYFLYTDEYMFRARLFQLTRRKDRTKRVGLWGLLGNGDVGDPVSLGLRNCGLKKLDRKKLLTALASGEFD